MNAIVKNAVIGSVSALLLGASLALSSAGVVSGASAASNNHAHLTAKKCDTPGWCLEEVNSGSGNAIEGLSGSSGLGVYGGSNSSYGVEGSSSSGDGVFGQSSSGYGVEGSSTSSDGVYGESSSSFGVYGYSANGVAGSFINDNLNFAALAATNEDADGYSFSAINAFTGGYFEVDNDGDGLFSGYVQASAFKTVIRSRDGENVGASVALTPQATMEDTGTARLLGGEGVVRFAPDFASTIDAGRGYQVFLTPKGDTHGLYVSAEYEGGFVVRENEHGRSSVYFDYRIVAHPHGLSDARLPRVTIKLPALPNLPMSARPQMPQTRP